MKQAKYYAIHTGRWVGVTTNQSKWFSATDRYSGAKQQHFKCKKDAEYYSKHGEVPTWKPSDHADTTDDVVTIYTSGLESGGRLPDTGCGVLLYERDEPKVAFSANYECIGTFNQASLSAIFLGLVEAAKEITNGSKVVLYSCSTYAVDTLTQQAQKWRDKGWKNSQNKAPKNLDLVKQCYSLYEKLRSSLTIKHLNKDNYTEGGNASISLASIAIVNKHEDIVVIPIHDVIETN